VEAGSSLGQPALCSDVAIEKDKIMGSGEEHIGPSGLEWSVTHSTAFFGAAGSSWLLHRAWSNAGFSLMMDPAAVTMALRERHDLIIWLPVSV